MLNFALLFTGKSSKMGFHRRYLLKYMSIINYVLKACFNKTKSQTLLKTILHDLKVKILFGLEISFKCLPDNILETLVTQCYTEKTLLKHYMQLHKCIFVSQETLNKFKLKNMQWVLINVVVSEPCNLPVLHYNRVVVLDSFNENECLLTSTNLFNLSNCDHTVEVAMLRIIKPLVDYEPLISRNLSISIMKSSVFKKDTQIILDKVLYNYFSLPKFVSIGDIVKLDVRKCYPESKYLLKPSNTPFVYFKIIELEGKNTQINLYNCKTNFYISNLHTKLKEINRSANTYLPKEKEFAINNLKNLNINNYNDFILNVFPGGMNDEGELLASWIKPFIQQKNRGNFSSTFFFFKFI